MVRNKPTYLLVIMSWMLILFVTFGYSVIYSNDKLESHIYNDFDIVYIDDTDNVLELNQVQQLPESMFQNDKLVLHKPESTRFSMWYKVTPNKTSGHHDAFTVSVDNPTLDTVHFYVVDTNNAIKLERRLGDHHTAGNALDHLAPHLDIYEGVTSGMSVFVRIKSKGSVATPLLIESIAMAQQRSSAQLMLLAALFGIGLIMIVYNYFMYRGLGDYSFLNYIFYVACVVSALSMINGFTFFLLPEAVAIWANEHILMSVHFLALAFAIRFAITFLRFDTIKPLFVEIGIKLSTLHFVIAGIGLVFDEGVLLPIYFAMGIVSYIYVITLMCMVLKSRLVWVRYYLVSWIPLLTGAVVTGLAFNGVVNYNFISRNGSLLGVLIEICIMAVAVLDRFRANQIDRDYRMNYDLVTGLPNQYLLDTAIRKNGQQKKKMHLAIFDIPQAKDVIPALGLESANKFFDTLFNNVEIFAKGLKGVYGFDNDETNKRFHTVRLDESRLGVLFIGELTDDEIEFNISTIKDAVSTFVTINDITMSVSCHAGVATYPNENVEHEKLISAAVQALIIGRKADKKWARYNEQQSIDIQQRFRLAADLQKAIENDDLELYHQPQINMLHNQVYGSELLLRWMHPVDGFIDPSKLIDIAEETGVIHQLTEWVIEKGLQQHSKLCKLGLGTNVSINISGKDFNDNGLVAHILTTSARYDIDPKTVTFEVTESATADDPKQVKEVLTELYDEGFKIAIDDFGTGYSSLDYLSQLPFHELKIDRCFMNIDVSERNCTITEVTLSLAKRLGVNAVAEGIENEHVAQKLIEFGCPVGQGYLYSKPRPFIEHMRWLQEVYKHNRDLMLDNSTLDRQ